MQQKLGRHRSNLDAAIKMEVSGQAEDVGRVGGSQRRPERSHGFLGRRFLPHV